MTRDDLEELRHLAELERRAIRKADLQRNGTYATDFGAALQRAAESIFPRDDSVINEAVQNATFHTRQLFLSSPELPRWVGDHEGLTDLDASEIIIEHTLSARDHDDDSSKPKITILPGPSTMPETVLGSMAHYDIRTDTRTFTGMSAGIIQMFFRAITAADANALMNLVALNLRSNWQEICQGRWHSITEISQSPADSRNAVISRESRREHDAVASLTFTYNHQWTTRTEPREGTTFAATFLGSAHHEGEFAGAPERLTESLTPPPPRVIFALGPLAGDDD